MIVHGMQQARIDSGLFLNPKSQEKSIGGLAVEMTGQLKMYSLKRLNKKQRKKLKDDIAEWIWPLLPLVLDEAIDEIIEKIKDCTFAGNDNLTLNLPFTICFNDLLTQVGKHKWKKKVL